MIVEGLNIKHEINNLKKENELLKVRVETLKLTLEQTMTQVAYLEESLRNHRNKPEVRFE